MSGNHSQGAGVSVGVGEGPTVGLAVTVGVFVGTGVFVGDGVIVGLAVGPLLAAVSTVNERLEHELGLAAVWD